MRGYTLHGEIVLFSMCSKPTTSFVVRDDVSAPKYCNSWTIASGAQPIILPGANSNKPTEFSYRIHFLSSDERWGCRRDIDVFSRHFLAAMGTRRLNGWRKCFKSESESIFVTPLIHRPPTTLCALSLRPLREMSICTAFAGIKKAKRRYFVETKIYL
jgi:hypothetical protein